MTKIKICGVTQLDDAARIAAAWASTSSASTSGPGRSRLPSHRRARVASRRLRGSAGSTQVVGVFSSMPSLAEILAVAADLDIIQLHGDEQPDDCVRIGRETGKPVWSWALAVKAAPRPRPARELAGRRGALLDAPSADARRLRHRLRLEPRARGAPPQPRAGGSRCSPVAVTSETVAEAIAIVEPWAVDVASGVEAAPGIKDADKLAAFVAAVTATQSR